MENPWFHPEPQSRFTEKVRQEAEVIREVSEDLAATDFGTRYVVREETRSEVIRETEFKAT
jgi:hypothetical protein